VSAQATFAATLVDEWVRCGVTHAVISPGSRSTPLVLALDEHPGIRLHVRLDEGSAGFFALGLALASGVPALLVTTSGTAAAEVHAAVVEASYARVPMIVCTADRPPELQGVGAPQTIDQTRLFGTAPRLYLDPGVASSELAGTWRPLAGRTFAHALWHPVGPGPVHVNLPFREPLVGAADPLPPARPGGGPWLAANRGGAAGSVPPRIIESIERCERGLLVAGAGCGDVTALYRLGTTLGWPVLADPRAIGRTPDPALVTAADSICASEAFVARSKPDLIVRFGSAPISKRLTSHLLTSGAPLVIFEQYWPWGDPDGTAAEVVVTAPDQAVAAIAAAAGTGPPTSPEWRDRWAAAESAAQAAIDEVLSSKPRLTEPALARTLYGGLGTDARLFAGSSMPIRDLEWFAAPSSTPPRVLANRGANGIDGVTSTALGAAMAEPASPLIALLGDLSFLHDLSALVWGDSGPPPATIVVANNGGGGIFSFLPQAASLEPQRFERLFGTPQSTDIAAVGHALGAEVIDLASTADVVELAGSAPRTLRVAVARTDRDDNVAVHKAINSLVAKRVELATGL
jgi:2-succinyl-5-enolpyruvyl-6-hydroxy-3-cyclohexene-1-carboxylate synthase